MMPIAPLMIEHRLIERMVRVMNVEIDRMKQDSNANTAFIDKAIDFIRTYADKLHHGKEEDILFRDLAKKKISAEHSRIMAELIEEHKFGRKITGEMDAAKGEYSGGKAVALNTIIARMATLTDFYPRHIEKEDKHFFIPVMNYFSKAEKDAMLAEENQVDKRFGIKKYMDLVAKLEGEMT